MDKQITCCFTGHRDIPESDFLRVKADTESNILKLYGKGYRNFICGGAVGFDQLAAEIVLELRKRLDIKLYLIFPCEGQDKYFTPEQKDAYERVKEQADGTHTLYPKYVRGCMHTRNRKMVENSSACIAYCTKTTGGSAYTVDYATKKGVDIIRV